MGKAHLKQKPSSQPTGSSEHAMAAAQASNQSIPSVGMAQLATNTGVVADCDTAIKDFEHGSRWAPSFAADTFEISAHLLPWVLTGLLWYACRAKAKKALQKLAKEHPESALPQRYLVSKPSLLCFHVNAQIIHPDSIADAGAPAVP